MELVKLYPNAVELEMWIKVQESLASRGIKPVSADRQWIEDSVTERKDQAAWVQSIQRQLAVERQKRGRSWARPLLQGPFGGRAQIQRMTPSIGLPSITAWSPVRDSDEWNPSDVDSP